MNLESVFKKNTMLRIICDAAWKTLMVVFYAAWNTLMVVFYFSVKRSAN